jgi:hypothetical protein
MNALFRTEAKRDLAHPRRVKPTDGKPSPGALCAHEVKSSVKH